MAQAQLIVTRSEQGLSLQGQRLGACSNCSKQDDCATVSLAQSYSRPVPVELAQQGLALQEGQTLQLHCDDRVLLGSLLRLFVPPLIGLLIVPLMLMACLPTAGWGLSLLACLVGLAAGLSLSRFYLSQRHYSWQQRADGQIVVNTTSSE